MKWNIFMTGIFFLGGIFFSCKKNPVVQNAGEPQWIKVIADSNVYFTGKIRADAQNNLFCSYNHRDDEVDSNSAIIKLDIYGTILWRREFTDLAIYDFEVSSQGNPVIVSYSNGMIIFKELSSSDGEESMSISNPFILPPFTSDKIKSLIGIKIFNRPAGNYLILGSVSYKINNNVNKQQTIGFMTELSPSGTENWLKNYIFPPDSETISITGYEPAADSFILFGSMQRDVRKVNESTSSEIITSFFTMKTSITGDSGSMKNFNTSSYDSVTQTYSGYYCATTDILPADDGNFYACAFNVLYNIASVPFPIYTNDDNSARIFKISIDGDTISSIRVKFGVQNLVADLARKHDGGLFIGLNPDRLANFSFGGERNSFIAYVSSGFTLENVSAIQTQYSDYLGSVCAMPDGHYAIETMIQSFGEGNYKLEVIKTDENGNF